MTPPSTEHAVKFRSHSPAMPLRLLERTSTAWLAATAEIFAYAASHFDHVIIDDFFFTDDRSAASEASLASRSVTLYPT